MEAQLNSYFVDGYLSPEARRKYLVERGIVRVRDYHGVLETVIRFGKGEEYAKAMNYISWLVNKKRLEYIARMGTASAIDMEKMKQDLSEETNKINKEQIEQLKEDIYEESNDIKAEDIPF